jgi:hypothetical protein
VSTLPQINHLLAAILGVPESEINDDTTLGNNEQEKWMHHRQVVDAIRENYDLLLEHSEISLDSNVGQIRRLLRSKGVMDV